MHGHAGIAACPAAGLWEPGELYRTQRVLRNEQQPQEAYHLAELRQSDIGQGVVVNYTSYLILSYLILSYLILS